MDFVKALSKLDRFFEITARGSSVRTELNAGVTTFAQLADAQDEIVQQVLAEAGSRFNVHDATTWNEQAALARDGKLDELKELQDRLKGGKEEQ